MKRKQITLALSLLTAAFLFFSCDITISDDDLGYYDDDLAGTSWTGDNYIISFHSNSRGELFDFYHSYEIIRYSFSYMYDSYDNSGTIFYDDIHDHYANDIEIFEIVSFLGSEKLIIEGGNEFYEDTVFTEVIYRNIQ